MMLYKLKINTNNTVIGATNSDGWFFPFSLENTDYANFKAQINSDEAQLEDADGNLMTAEQAKEFVVTLP